MLGGAGLPLKGGERALEALLGSAALSWGRAFPLQSRFHRTTVRYVFGGPNKVPVIVNRSSIINTERSSREFIPYTRHILLPFSVALLSLFGAQLPA